MICCPVIDSLRQIFKVHPGIETRLPKSIVASSHNSMLGILELNIISSYAAFFIDGAVKPRRSGRGYKARFWF